MRNVTNPRISSELAGFAAARQFRGVFELHLTVPPLEENAQREFRDLCAQLALKPILIHAPGAFMALQPMTSSYLQGEAPLVAEETHRLLGLLARAGFPALRCKLEATLASRGVPRSDDEVNLAAGRYFEFHAKLLLPPGQIEQARLRCLELGAHLSSNAARLRPDHLQERFLTLRCHDAGQPAALTRFRTLLAGLRRQGFHPHHLLHEYSVLDTNSLLDQGWLALPSRCLPL
ncbi:MAG: hypothetical protein MUF64_31260 [Polyangiaceae bacterium]|nr:hypothetical protein [Polyangiaceae bacterium]